MTALTALWLPILLSAVLVFIVSSFVHMLPLWHKHDYPAVTGQDQVMDAIRPFSIPPGDYMLPRAAGMKEMGTPEFREKMKRGPVAIITVIDPDKMSMGRNLSAWFVFILIVSYFAAYIAGRALAPGADYLEVFRFAGATAFIGYAVALWQVSIWYHRAWRQTIVDTFDGLLYALVTAGTFGWLWPAA